MSVKKEPPEMLAGELKAFREQMGLSIATLADLLGVTDSTVKHWERGRYRIPEGAADDVRWLRGQTIIASAAVATLCRKEDHQGRTPLIQVERFWDALESTNAERLGPGWWRTVAREALVLVPGARIGLAQELRAVWGVEAALRAITVHQCPDVVLPSTN